MISNMKILACDIDGTLCPKGEMLMPLTRQNIIRLHEDGVLFGPASGRPVDSRILSKAQEWGLGFEFDFAIGMNGGELYEKETGQVEKYWLLSRENIRRILTFLSPFDINAIVYVNGYEEVRAMRMDEFMTQSQKRNHSHVIIGGIDTLSEFDTGKLEVQFKEDQREGILRAVAENSCPDWTMVQTFRNEDHCTFEFQDPHVNKGVALEKLAEKHHIPLDEVMAFGDQDNDIGLIRTAGWGVCMSNGCDESKAVAQAITEHSVEDDGVGHYLEDHWFKDRAGSGD